MSRSFRLLLVCSFLLLISAPGQAVDRPALRDPRTLESSRAEARPERIVPQDGTQAGVAVGRFLQARGGDWSFNVDRRTGRATLIQGSGIPLIPGRGNSLSPDALAGLTLPDGEVRPETLEPLVQQFIRSHPDLLVPPTGELKFDPDTSVSRDDGRLHSLYYRWFVGAVPVEDARVFVRINNGNITQFGAPLIGRTDVDPVPAFDGIEAKRILLDWSGDGDRARMKEQPRLVIQPEDDGNALSYRLVWVVTYTVAGRIETWEGRVDAHDGDVVRFRDTNLYGRATGGVYPRTVIDAETTAPMPLLNVAGDVSATTDTAGKFAYTGGQISSGLDGTYFTTNCEACTGPGQASSSASIGSGRLDFGFGGLDDVANGFSTRAERNGFYHMNQVRRVVKKWLNIGWLDSNIGVNVNIQDTCNAVWTGSANFFRSGGGCNNTGEVSDVMYHEWGHGLDGNTRGGDGATGEATADIVSMHVTHSALVGPYFRTNGNPVRDINSATSTRGVLSTTNVGSECPVIGTLGPLGYEVHCEGEIYGQAAWDLSQALVSRYGHQTGWRTSEQIFFEALPDSGSYLSTGSFPIYDAYMNADDDDGNLANGTPNAVEIFSAFDTHGIAGTSYPASPACARPAQPALVATPQCDGIDLSWNAITGVSGYTVFKSELLEDRAYYHVADVAPGVTTYADTEVAPGVDYFYVVMATATDGCESTIENPVAANLNLQPLLNATAVIATDEPQGNRSGFADPGETVDLIVTLENKGTLDATSIAGTLTSPNPGVMILDDTDGWPAIAIGGQASNSGVLRFETDDLAVACGDTLQFQLSPSDASLCLSDTSFIEVTLGDRVVTLEDNFETDQGWSYDAVNSTASSGAWVLGDPDGTTYQPEDDVSDPGTQAWFTATNGGGLGADDVDNGVAILVSPVYDLSANTTAVLSFYRWFANRDIGEDAGDFFAVDVNDGSGWVNLETLGTNESAASWTRREFALQDFVTLTSTVQIRFQVADGTATGNLIEAAVDEIRVDEAVCDPTPACFVEPTFGGLQSATAGTSCGEISLGWNPASSNCINATLDYNVYRSTLPGFTPGPANLIAAGVSATSFQDVLLEPGAFYHYVVRAEDSRSGEDSNALELSVPASTALDTSAPLFGGIQSLDSGVGCGETVLAWSPALESCSDPVAFNIYRSTDPAFTPGPATRIGSTLSLAFVDAAITPDTAVTYVVRAVDELGNEDTNDVRLTTDSGALDLVVVETGFEPDEAGWKIDVPNDAATGSWEWGDPEGDAANPENDRTDFGVNAWITGLAAQNGAGNNDVDDGTTTLASKIYDLTGMVDPAVRYSRWFTNDQGDNPGEDFLDVEVNDGSGWTLVEQVTGGPLAWVDVQYSLSGLASPTNVVQFRFRTSDQVGSGSIVEAGVDEFAVIDLGQGCLGCTLPVNTVGIITADIVGDDVVLDWTPDPVVGTRYLVYRLEGPTFADATLVGTTDTKTFVHEGAMLSNAAFNYRVAAVDACANESVLE